METGKPPALFTLLASSLIIAVILASCAQSAASSSSSITINPTFGGPNTWVTVIGDGFPPDIVLNVRLGPPDVGASPQSYAQVAAKSEGTFLLTFMMPGHWPDGTPITETDLTIVVINEDGSVKATAPFDYQPDTASQPDFALRPGAGAPGQQIVAIGRFFPAGARIALRLGVLHTGLNNADLVQVVADDSGAFEATLTVPTTWPGSDVPVTERDLVVAAVDEGKGQTLASAAFLNVEDSTSMGEAIARLSGGCDEHPIAGRDGWPEGWPENQELAGNPFETLLGPIRAPDRWSVRPCSGETPLLCVYQLRTLLGSVKLVTFPLARHLDFQKMLSNAGIPLGSVDVTNPEYAPQAHEALAAYAAAYLADLEQDRSVTYPEGYTFSPMAPEENPIGDLPGVAYGFAGVDQDGHTVERWLTYAAFDNDVLYLFCVFYATGLPESFPSDEELLHFEPYLRQTLVGLRLPVSEDYLSPGAELPQGPRLVVQRPDDSIQYVSLDGTIAVLVADAPASLLPAGFDRVPMTDGPQVYLWQWTGSLYVLDTPVGHLIPLDFIPSPASPVAVRPLTDEPFPEGQPMSSDWAISLAWGGFSASHTASARLYLATQDGSQRLEALEETYATSDPWTQFVPWRWRRDGQLFFTKEPVDGMGGFHPFVNAANLWVYSLRDGSSEELVSDAVTGGKLCLDAISPDDRLMAHHCDEGQITLLDLETGETTAISLPDQTPSGAHLGSIRFSPDGSRIAFAVMAGGYGLIEETRGYVAVSDGLSGSSDIVTTSEPGEWLSVAAWLPGDTLVLQSHFAGPDGWPAVWSVGADGSGLVKLVDGTFLASFEG